jgi:hypothetical protein
MTTVAPPPLSQAAVTKRTELSDLPEDLLEDIFLRLLPEMVGCIRSWCDWYQIHASFVCKSWHRIISDESSFCRRYFARHQEAIVAQRPSDAQPKVLGFKTRKIMVNTFCPREEPEL